MNIESGMGSGSPYEYVVAEKKTKTLKMKKLTFILIYVFWCAGLLLVGSTTKLFLPLLAFIPISTWILVFLTWRYTQVEYEYSVFSGNLTVSRILGGRKRKVLTEVKIKDLSAVLPYEDEFVPRIDSFGAKVSVMAASAQDAPNAYIALWDVEGTRHLLCFEPDERILKFIRYYNNSALTLRKS